MQKFKNRNYLRKIDNTSNIVSSMLASIEHLVATNADSSQFIDTIHKFVSIAPLSLASYVAPGTKLFRATNHHTSLPQNIHELWYPPEEKSSLGRANYKGQSVFYCSSDPSCVFHEIGTQLGNLVVLATWATTEQMLLHEIGYSDKVLTRAESRRRLPKRHKTFNTRLNPEHRKIREQLFLAFTEPTSTKYALTAAIAEVFLRADEIAGIMYPAVSKFGNVDNLAIRPQFVHTGLRLKEAQLVKVDTIGTDKSIGGEILFDLSSVGEDGTLSWVRRDSGRPIQPKESIEIPPGFSEHALSDVEIEVDGLRYSIKAGYLLENNASGFSVRDLRGDLVNPL